MKKYSNNYFSPDYSVLWEILTDSNNNKTIALDANIDFSNVVNIIQNNTTKKIKILNNIAVHDEYVYECILYLLQHFNINIDCYFPMSYEQATNLLVSNSNSINKVVFYNIKPSDIGIKEIPVPIIYISGMSEFCEQIHIHELLSKLLDARKIVHLNLSNSPDIRIDDYTNVDDLIKMSLDGFDTNNLFGKIVSGINQSVYKKAQEMKSQLILVSDKNGIGPYNLSIHNQYGCYNSILRYALPYDYVVYNIYAQNYSERGIQQIIKNVSHQTLSSNITLGMAHTFLDIMHQSLVSTDISLKMNEEEYKKIFNSVNEVASNILDPYSHNDWKRFINHISN